MAVGPFRPPGVAEDEDWGVALAPPADELELTISLAGDGGGGWPTLMMMSPNCSGVLSRPSVCSGSWKALPCPTGGCPTAPGAASTFWARTALATSLAVMFRAASSCGSSQMRIE